MSQMLICLLLLLVPAGNAQLDKILHGLGGKNDLSDPKISSGLKEALQIGAGRAVDLTSATDGFFRNQAIKILLPEKLRAVEKPLRMIGFGKKLDEFELSMNRAAEKAAPAARGIFGDALKQMTFTDARKILTGGGSAATDYFKEKTSGKLRLAFAPTVQATMADTGVVKQYNQISEKMQSLPFGRGQDLNITDYVVGKTLDGIFYMLAQEEKKIRTDPAAQITPLLKEVFGRRQ